MRRFADPNNIPRSKGGGEQLTKPLWRYVDYEDMDERFVAAMQQAGYCATSPSTMPGTKAPRAGYQRPDSLPRL